MPTTSWTVESGGDSGETITDEFDALVAEAQAARDKAQEWAINPEDDPVETVPDRFSALHWAAKALGYRNESVTSADRAEAVGMFDNRAEVAAWVAAPNVPVDGRTYAFSGQLMRGLTGSTALPSLGGMAPVGNFANADLLGLTTGTVSDAVALTNAQRINAWLALADCNVFDCRADQIGIGETIRLGRNGNGLTGIPAQLVFGLPVSGAILKFQGTAGADAVLCQPTSTTADLQSPSVYGITINGNSLAGRGVVYEGCMKPDGDMIHVYALRDNSASYGFVFRHNPNHTGTDVNCCYGGRFGQLTVNVNGAANGVLLSGKASASGTNATFNQFKYIHVACTNGYSLVLQKGDDNVFTQIGVSRSAGGTNGAVLFNTAAASLFVWVGNVIHNMNLSKTDGAAMEIIVNDDRTFGNSTTYNGVDFKPTLTLSGGSLLDDNHWHFLGRTDYLGAWADKPFATVPPLPNADSTDPLVLDWYQEGTFTPGMTIGGSATGITFTTQTGTYTRIGNKCTAHIVVTLSSKGAGSGDVKITGLPFSQAAGDGLSHSITTGYYANFVAGITTAPFGFVSSSDVSLYKAGAGTAAALQASDMNNNSRIEFAVTWRVA